MAELDRSSFIKICGVTSMRDAELVHRAGADALGLIVAPSSRHVSVAVARNIADWARGQLLSVLVARDLTEGEVARAVDAIEPAVVQLHDPPSASLLEALRGRGMLVIRALAAGANDFWDFDDQLVDAVIVDGPSPGSGVAHGWPDVERRTWSRPLIAAGGLTSSTVSDVIERSWVWGVDVVSGVERAPGVKDADAVTSFVARARSAFARRS